MKYTVDKPQRPINRSIFGTSSYLKAYVYRPTGLPGVPLDLPASRELVTSGRPLLASFWLSFLPSGSRYWPCRSCEPLNCPGFSLSFLFTSGRSWACCDDLTSLLRPLRSPDDRLATTDDPQKSSNPSKSDGLYLTQKFDTKVLLCFPSRSFRFWRQNSN